MEPSEAPMDAKDPADRQRGMDLSRALESLREPLGESKLAPHRRAQAFHWLNQGIAACDAGKPVIAQHCLDRLRKFLASQAPADSSSGTASVWSDWDRQFWGRGLASSRRQIETHGKRLTPMERTAYTEQMDAGVSGRATYWSIRRSITERLLRSRLNALQPPLLKTNLVTYGSDMPVGPYNHRKTVEAALRMIESMDAGWVRDFLRTYTEGLTAFGQLATTHSKSSRG